MLVLPKLRYQIIWLRNILESLFAAAPEVLEEAEELEEQMNPATNNRGLGLGTFKFGPKILKNFGKKITKIGQEIHNGKN